MTLTRAVSAECWVKNKSGGKALEIVGVDNFLKRVITKKTGMEQMIKRNLGPRFPV